MVSLVTIAMMACLNAVKIANDNTAANARKLAWVTAKNNVSTILQSSSACAYTVASSDSIRTAANTIFLRAGTVIMPQLTVASVTINSIGGMFAACNEDGNSNNYKCDVTGQQTQVTVTVMNKKQVLSQTYYLNLLTDGKGHLKGCL